MNIIQKDFVLILKSAITGEKYTLSDKFNTEEAFKLGDKHSVLPLVFAGASNCGIPMNDNGMRKLFDAYCQSINIHEGQVYELSRIFGAFEENQIDYMPLKGCNMKPLYPKPEMRVMGDADILINLEQYSNIEKIMTDLGFNFKLEGDHDFAWENNNLHVELHYRLLVPYNDIYEEFFGNGWKLADNNIGHKYFMKKEDEFIYQFVHFTKHYRNGGGIGCRHIVDLWVYSLNNQNMDFSYIENILDQLSILEFYKNISRTIDVWFDEKSSDDVTNIITDFIFNSGSWGTEDNHAAARTVKSKQLGGSLFIGKINVVIEAAFPPLEQLKHRYTILKKHSYLLPAIWVWRWIDAFKNRRYNFDAYKKQVGKVLNNEISDFEESLNKVGLNFELMDNKGKY